MAHLLRILADSNIPFAPDAFGRFGAVHQIPGEEIAPSQIADVDVLLVRSVTKVDRALLAGTPVRFVGTATAGTDHVDKAYLNQAGIRFASAPGSNATSVVEYTLAALLSVASDLGMGLRGRTLGVVGCGWIGGAVAARAEAFGMAVLRCDPPLAVGPAPPFKFVEIEEILEESDFITVHTPLTPTNEEIHSTYRLFGPAAFSMMKPEAVLVNAARGPVVDNSALKAALQSGRIAGAVLDVWENEPDVDVELAKLVRIATPHIAGYGFDGKVEGTRMLEDALRTWTLGLESGAPQPWNVETSLGSLSRKDLLLHALPLQDSLDSINETRWLNVLVRQAYNLRKDDTRFRQAVLAARPDARAFAFRELRRTYPVRRTWGRFTVKTLIPEWLEQVVTEGLGMTLAQ